jgi:YidC/Oxa1 family membrane protein insertase
LVLAVLIVLYIGSQLLSTVLTPTTGDRNQRLLMYGLPFLFTFFIFSFPAGLLVYWITTNLWTVGQGYILRKKMGPMAPPKLEPAVAGAGGAGGGSGGAGGLLAKLTGAAPASAPSERARAPAKSAPSGPPPRPPRKKKKRSGRRR